MAALNKLRERHKVPRPVERPYEASPARKRLQELGKAGIAMMGDPMDGFNKSEFKGVRIHPGNTKVDEFEEMFVSSHLRGDGTKCPYMAEDYCNKCGWVKDPSVPAKDKDIENELVKKMAREIAEEVDQEWADTYGRAAVEAIKPKISR